MNNSIVFSSYERKGGKIAVNGLATKYNYPFRCRSFANATFDESALDGRATEPLGSLNVVSFSFWSPFRFPCSVPSCSCSWQNWRHVRANRNSKGRLPFQRERKIYLPLVLLNLSQCFKSGCMTIHEHVKYVMVESEKELNDPPQTIDFDCAWKKRNSSANG